MSGHEPWRPPSEGDGPRSIWKDLFAPLTEEQMKEYRDRQGARLMMGALNWPSLPVYSMYENCPKCSQRKHKLLYMDSGRDRSAAAEEAFGENPGLSVTCKRCGFTWFRKPMDAPVKEVAE